MCVPQFAFLRGSMESIRCTLEHPREPICVPLWNIVKFNAP